MCDCLSHFYWFDLIWMVIFCCNWVEIWALIRKVLDILHHETIFLQTCSTTLWTLGWTTQQWIQIIFCLGEYPSNYFFQIIFGFLWWNEASVLKHIWLIKLKIKAQKGDNHICFKNTKRCWTKVQFAAVKVIYSANSNSFMEILDWNPILCRNSEIWTCSLFSFLRCYYF